MAMSKRGIGSAVVLAGAILSCTLPPDEAQEGRGVEVVTLPADAGGRWALVVGNAGYESGKLRNPLNDVADMTAMLEELGFAVEVLENAGLQAMEDAIRAFDLRLRTGGVGVFYYAGHAVQVDGVNYLIPVGAEIRAESEIRYKSVNLGFLLDHMGEARNRLNIVILDACRDNPFRSFRSLKRGLAETKTPIGTLIAYATAPGGVAADGTGRNGVFTEHLLAALRIPGLTIEQVMKRTRRAVIEATADQQVPWTASSLVGEFIPRPLPAERSDLELQRKAESTPKEIVSTLSSEPEPEEQQPKHGERWQEEAVGMWFRYLPEGTFQMGSPESEKERFDDETLHQVKLTRGFRIGETEVTQDQWKQLAGNNPSRFKDCGGKCPVENVNWYEALWYANELSKRAGFAPCYELSECNGKNAGEDLECSTVTFKEPGYTGYRLPTEAEWEYAARAGTGTPFWTGGNLPTDQANYAGHGKGKYRKTTVEVRSFDPNPWGLYEVHGNVWEWVWDWYGPYSGEAVDPIGPQEAGSNRVFRGGGWINRARYCRAADRNRSAPGIRSDILGFRLVRTYP